MADTLFPAAGQLLSNAGEQQLKQKDQDQEIQKEGVEAGQNAAEGERKKQMAILQAQLDRAGNMMDITPQIGLGLIKATGNKDWFKAIGQKQPAAAVLAFLKDGMNQKLMGKVFKVPHGDKELSMTLTQDEDGNLIPQVLGEGEKFSPTQKGEVTPEATAKNAIAKQNADANTTRASKTGSKSAPKPEDPSKEADKWFKNANTARKEIQDTFNKKGGMPKSGKAHDVISYFSGGDPDNDAKIASLKQNYSDYKTAVQNYNQLAEKNGKAAMTIDPSVSAAMDKIMTLPGAKDSGAPAPAAADPNAEAKKWLKDHNLPDSDANVQYYLKNK